MISKLIFFLVAGFNGLYLVSLFFIVLELIQKLPFAKRTELIIMTIAVLVMAAGTICGVRLGILYAKYVAADIILVVTTFTAFLTIMIGMLYFNGPVKLG